jgi:hypothetical protein
LPNQICPPHCFPQLRRPCCQRYLYLGLSSGLDFPEWSSHNSKSSNSYQRSRMSQGRPSTSSCWDLRGHCKPSAPLSFCIFRGTHSVHHLVSVVFASRITFCHITEPKSQVPSSWSSMVRSACVRR